MPEPAPAPAAGWAAAPADTSVIAALRQAQAPLPALHFDCGRDDPLLGPNRRLHDELTAVGIAHHYAEHEGGHDWSYWQRHLGDTLRFCGEALATRGSAA